jgi:hypothetical protein
MATTCAPKTSRQCKRLHAAHLISVGAFQLLGTRHDRNCGMGASRSFRTALHAASLTRRFVPHSHTRNDSPTGHLPARPARPIICKYWARCTASFPEPAWTTHRRAGRLMPAARVEVQKRVCRRPAEKPASIAALSWLPSPACETMVARPGSGQGGSTEERVEGNLAEGSNNCRSFCGMYCSKTSTVLVVLRNELEYFKAVRCQGGGGTPEV